MPNYSARTCGGDIESTVHRRIIGREIAATPGGQTVMSAAIHRQRFVLIRGRFTDKMFATGSLSILSQRLVAI